MTDKEKPRARRASLYPYCRRAGKVYLKEPTAARSCALPIESEPETRPAASAPEAPPEKDSEGSAYEEYLRENPATGQLKVQAYRAREALPQSDVDVTVSSFIGETEHVFFSGRTDGDGLIDNIALPAPARASSLSFGDPHPSATYLLNAVADGFVPLTVGITIFDGIKTIQPLPMIIRREGDENAADQSS